MGLFIEEQKLEPVPRTTGSKKAETYLKNLLQRTPDIPLQGTAELTPVQMAIQGMTPDLLSQVTRSGDLATGEYRDILEGDYDPRTSPYYEGLRQESERLKKEGVTSLRQRAELGGMLTSSGAAVSEASFLKQSNSALLRELGRLLETERGRKLLAAEGIQSAEARKIGNVAAVGGIAEEARSIEQQRADALYIQSLQMALAPYQYQAKIAESLMNYSPDYAVTGGGMTDLGFGLNVGGSVAGGFIGAGGLDLFKSGNETAPASLTTTRGRTGMGY